MTSDLRDLIPNRVFPGQLDAEERLFRHVKRPEWGIGLWVEERTHKRRLRFEDGTLRAFREGFYHLLEPVDPASIDAEAVAADLGAEHATADTSSSAKPPVMTFDEQLVVFGKAFEGGLGGPAYLQARRDPESSARNNPGAAAAQAQEILAQHELGPLLEQQEFAAVCDRALSALQRTAWVTASKRDQAARAAAAAPEAFARALVDLLWGDRPYRDRFEDWLRVLGGAASDWRVATVLPALVHPDQHVFVRRQVTNLQARSVHSASTVPQAPSRVGYRNARRIALATRKRLDAEVGRETDLLDVACFIWESLRPGGQKLAKSLR